MHVNFLNLKEKVEQEQERTIQMQRQMFQMMKEIQTFAIGEAKRSTRVLSDVSQQCANFHNRCIPQYKQKDYDMGISAVTYRQKRDSLQQQNKISRKKAEEILRQNRLEDLDVWQDCVPLVTTKTKVSNRGCRVKTRQIAKQLELANKETEGAKFPLEVVEKVVHKKRDATAEVGRSNSFYNCILFIIIVIVDRKSNTWSTKH